MSGGLDSTFLVGVLAGRLDLPVDAYCHVPHPDALCGPSGNWDPDDSHVAEAMERAYPGRVRLLRVFNEDLKSPLDAAHEAAERSWVPTVNPDNQVWITQIQRLAGRNRAEFIFSGETGNFSFSHEPTYAVGHYVRRGDWKALIDLAPEATGNDVSRKGALFSRFLGPSVARVRGRFSPPRPYSDLVGLPHTARRDYSPRFGRREYLEWLADSTTSLSAGLSPSGQVLPIVDPFTAANVLRLAASISPREWSRGPYPRGFARNLGVGLVPDEIRLRTRRGDQAADTWFAVRGSKDRHMDEIDLVASTPVLGGWVDSGAVKDMVQRWPWGQAQGPDHAELSAVHRLLTLANFVRVTETRLEQLPRDRTRPIGVEDRPGPES
jgi:hypothetical protein